MIAVRTFSQVWGWSWRDIFGFVGLNQILRHKAMLPERRKLNKNVGDILFYQRVSKMKP